MRRSYFTSESVTEGHPDKVADAISDAVLDAALTEDPHARVACESFVTTDLVVVGGEITAKADLDIERIVRDTILYIGYDGFDPGFDGNKLEVLNRVDAQSPDIAAGVDGEELGAGDQGLMFGFAVREADEMMPMPIYIAHRIAERLAAVRHSGEAPYLRPDGKTQVMVRYEGQRPVAVEKVLVSTQHAEEVESEDIRDDVLNRVVRPVIPDSMGSDFEFLFNPTGRFVIGGPVADTGLTGRKIIVDTYGGYARHGGGAFSGKDSTKVDRSAAYAARWAAKNLVAAGLADRIEIQVAYAIGRPEPFSIDVQTFGTEKIDPDRIVEVVEEVFDFRPASIIKNLNLTSPLFSATAAYGHFGRPTMSWESLEKVEAIKTAAGI